MHIYYTGNEHQSQAFVKLLTKYCKTIDKTAKLIDNNKCNTLEKSKYKLLRMKNIICTYSIE